MREKMIFPCKLFFAVKYFRLKLFLCKTATPLKKITHRPSQQPHLKIEILSSPLFLKTYLVAPIPTERVGKHYVDRIARAFNRSGAMQAAALDICMAFARVCHADLLHKLKSYRISGQIFELISFLSNRQFWTGCLHKSIQFM